MTMLLPLTAQAADTRVLTLDQALALAASNNHDIAKAKEYGRMAQGKYLEERSAALPSLSLNGHMARQVDKAQSEMGLGLVPERQDGSALSVGVSQALYTWGKVGAAIRAAEKGFKTADEKLRQANQNTDRDVAVAFYDILLAREQREIGARNLAQREKHLTAVQNRFAAGVATDYDVLAARVAVENSRPELIRADNQLRSCRDRLRFLLALPEEVDAAGSLETAMATLPGYEEALAVARDHRPELAELHRWQEVYAEVVTIARADNKPRLDLKGGYGWEWLSAGDNSADGKAWNLGVYLSFPFFDGLKTAGKVAQAESDLRGLNIDEAKMRDAIALEIRNALQGVNEAAEIVAALTGTVGQAERLLTMAEKGYELGVKISLEVEDAQVNLLAARGNLARARRDYLAARVDLERAMGVLGEKDGVEKNAVDGAERSFLHGPLDALGTGLVKESWADLRRLFQK
ncbi:MAG: TolC family protein [Desulfobulbaceae bacterium]|nr:TolC family protein [Desulfobulbaceae bacterium]